MRIFVAFLALLMLSGCAAWIRANSDVVTLVNDTEYNLEVVRDGRTVVVRLTPGEHIALYIYRSSYSIGTNSSGYSSSRSMSIVVKAFDNEGKHVGSASRSFWVSSYDRRSESWIIRKYDLAR